MRRLLAEQERSGLTLAEFARRRGVRAGTLSWWRHRLRSEGARRRLGKLLAKSGERAAEHEGFVEIAPPAALLGVEPGGAGWFEVVLGDGTVVRVPARFAEADLGRLLALLRC